MMGVTEVLCPPSKLSSVRGPALECSSIHLGIPDCVPNESWASSRPACPSALSSTVFFLRCIGQPFRVSAHVVR
jgi:hypothetical protein